MQLPIGTTGLGDDIDAEAQPLTLTVEEAGRLLGHATELTETASAASHWVARR